MPNSRTTAQIRGMAIGAAILTLFGLAWSLAALLNWPAHPTWSIVLALALAAALVAASAKRALHPGGRPAIDPEKAAADGRRSGMWFGIIFTLEGVFIAIAAILLSAHHLADWIPAATACIVGLHFLPLARLFRVPLYYATGILSVAAAAATFAIHDPLAQVVFLGLAMAAILWLTSTVILVQAGGRNSSQ
jgi:hypothetical protein